MDQRSDQNPSSWTNTLEVRVEFWQCACHPSLQQFTPPPYLQVQLEGVNKAAPKHLLRETWGASGTCM